MLEMKHENVNMFKDNLNKLKANETKYLQE